MDQAIGMDHLAGRGKGQRRMPVAAAQAAKFQHINRAQAFSAGKQTVAHGGKELLLRLLRPGKAAGQVPLHGLGIGLQSFVIRLRLHG